jgi:hypothetical protein
MIHIIQCLCPERHAIFATCYDPKEMPDDVAMATMQATIEEWLAKKIINPWCGICGGKKWHYETRRTRFTTMEEALPVMKQLETANRVSREIIDGERKARRN